MFKCLPISLLALIGFVSTTQYTTAVIQTPKQVAVETPKDSAIASLSAQGYQLIFFVSSRCGYCHRFAPVVKSLVDRYGFPIQVVSFDGQGTSAFPAVMPITRAIYQQFYGEREPFAPRLLLNHPNKSRFVVLAEGLTAYDTVINILYDYTQQPESIQ